MRTIARWGAVPLAVMLLAACGPKATNEPAAKPSTKTLAATVQADKAYGALDRAINNAGLQTALTSVGPYTLFAPSDAALNPTAAGVDFADAAHKAEGAAFLRAHIVPGAVTRGDISAAIDRAGAKGAEMRTMAGGLITFTRDGEAIVATSADGAHARLSGKEGLVSNGVLQPIDGLLVQPASPPAG